MSNEYESAIKKMRDLFAAQIITEMTPMEINKTFQKLHDRAEAAEKRIAELEAEREQRDIEMQIKALDDIINGVKWAGDMGCLVVPTEYIGWRMKQLRKEGE